jgi:hypothetical protein
MIAGENDEIIERISDGFKSRLKMKDLGEPKRILGLDLIEVPEGIMLCGKSVIEDLLRRTNMLNCRPVSTPMDPNQSFVPNPDKTEEDSNRLSFASGHWILTLHCQFLPSRHLLRCICFKSIHFQSILLKITGEEPNEF